MRFILNIILLFFILLIALERSVLKLLAFLRRTYKKCKKSSLKIFHKPGSFRIRFSPKLKKRRSRKDIFSFLFRIKIKYFVLGVLFSFFFLFLPLVFLVFLQELPSPRELAFRQIPQTTKIFDRNGVLLAEFYTSQNRTLISLSDVPKHLQQATLAIEDKNFYQHPGFDVPSLLRAMWETALRGNMQGGSTITQQLIKSSMLTPEKSMSRKVKEMVLAFWAERIYTKNQILEMYFNQVPYGGMAWGVEAASETYFSKSVKNLTLAESAFLAGLTSAPSYYSPYGNYPTAWKNRQKEVLNRMASLHYISQKQADEAAKEQLDFKEQRAALYAPHFTTYVKDLLISKYGLATVEKGGLQVTTTLDLKTQEMSERIVKEEVENAAYLNLTNGSALITNPKTGEILAMVGSKDFDDPVGGNVNIATSLRQPGSSIKVVTYAAALSDGFTAATNITDSPSSFPDGTRAYKPVNYDGKYHGRVSLRFALANSLNIPAVKLLNQIGVPALVDLANDMGITSWGEPSDYGLSLTLGAGEVTMLEMAEVNGTLANDGKHTDLNPILKITDAKGNVLEKKTTAKGRQVLSEGVAFIVSDILADNQSRSTAFGPNSPLVIPGHRVSVKTGTTDNKRDNWTNGYTDNYVVIVWVGNNDNSPMSQELASGITGAAPIWHRIMENLLSQNPEAQQNIPEEVVQRPCSGKLEYFLKETEQTVDCSSQNPRFPAYSVR